MNNIQQPEISIYSNVDLDKMLLDVRQGRYGQKFGRVKDICRQYGIKYRQTPNGLEFTAPKLRLQMFIEKLHFSKTYYRKNS
jgi:hypothetical protein